MRSHSRVSGIILSMVLLALWSVPDGAGAQTFPRRDLRFSANWKYFKGYAAGAQATDFADNSWATVCLPHTANVESAIKITNYGYWKGTCEYRKSFVPDPSWNGKKVFLEFEAAMQTDTIWVNGNQKLVYPGGYNPFTIDITGDLRFGQTNVVAVCLNNNVNTSVSPGEQPDFFYYGGLYRDVKIHIMDSMHITDAVYANKVADGGIFVTDSAVSAGSAIVRVRTNVINEYGTPQNCMLSTSIIDSNGTVIQSASSQMVSIAPGKDTTFLQNFTVLNPRLWSPSAPNLYTVLSQVYDGPRPADSMTTVTGIKSVSFSRTTGFTLNGTSFIARGANRHQDYGGIGNAVPVSGQYRDALRLKEAGFNWVRLSHYLQSSAFIDACDRLGILVEPALVGWQYTSGYSNATFTNNLKRDLRTLIRYYRNHASIACWESAMNESSPPVSWLDTAQKIVRAELPGVQAYTVGQQSSSCGTASNVFDIYQAAVQQCGRSPSGVTTPFGISEYGHWEFGGYTSSSMRTRANLDTGLLRQARNHDSALSANRALATPKLSFDAVWVYNDYFGMSNYANGFCGGGIVDVFRYPKYSWYMYQSQRDPAIVMPGIGSGPMVFIANQWRSTSPTSVTVFSNCDSVSLYLNGTLVSEQGPDVGGKTGNLEHPPFTFTVPSWQSGTLHAEGVIGGAVRASHEIKTPLAAKSISVAIDTAKMKLLADGSDIAIVYASIVDSNGTVLPAATDSVILSVSGPATLITPDGNPVTAIGGIAEAYLQTQYLNAGRITVSASSGSLTGGSALVTSVMPANMALTGIRQGNAGFRVLQNARMLQRGERISFMVPERTAKIRFELYSLQGRLVRSWNLGPSRESSVSTSSCPPGMYFGKLTYGNSDLVQRVLRIGN